MSCGKIEAWVCSRSHGQPPGARNCATIWQRRANSVAANVNSAAAEGTPSSIDFILELEPGSNPPEGAMGAEFGDLGRGFLAHVNRYSDHAQQGADENKRH